MTLSDRRILLVHAHPDDETIGNGATMAKYAAEGVQVTLVTCTAGEEGEVLVPELEHLAADRDDALGPHRIEELAAAMKALGVTDHRFLGGPGHFRDSGMKWAEDGSATVADETRPDTFWHADLTVAADLLVEIIREVRPQVLVTYDQFGGYGHPDHIQAHRVATYATSLAAVRVLPARARRGVGHPQGLLGRDVQVADGRGHPQAPRGRRRDDASRAGTPTTCRGARLTRSSTPRSRPTTTPTPRWTP